MERRNDGREMREDGREEKEGRGGAYLPITKLFPRPCS